MNCPNPKALQALLDETLSAEDQPTIQAHLDTCERCQKVLEHLAAGGATWDKTAENLTPQSERDDTALFNVVEKLQEAPTKAETPTVPTDVDLSFLQPSQRPDALGRLDEYEILSVVGKGGFGIVLKAFEEELHRIVAIKVLAPEIASHGTARERFVREAKAAAAVTHENIVTIHRVKKDATIPYLVMQFIGGLTLSQKIDQAGLLSVKEILRIGVQIAEGLAAAHKHGVVHRDIKPANILLENGVERVKITDFGLARAADDASVTQSGTVAGTPMYMSPEQANGEPIDLRSDLFSLGSVLYVMCTGKAPFRANSTMAVMKRVCDETPRPIQESNPDIPVWLSDIVTKLHAKKPADRFQTAKEVAELLGQHLAELQAGRAGSVSDRSAAATIDAATPVAAGSPKRRRIRWAVVLPMLAGMFVVAVVVGWRFLPRGGETVTQVPENPPFVPVFGGPDWRPLMGNFFEGWRPFLGAEVGGTPGQPQQFNLAAGTSVDTIEKLPRNFHLRMEVNLAHGEGTVRFHARPRERKGDSPLPREPLPKDGWFLNLIANQADNAKLDAGLSVKDAAIPDVVAASSIARLGEWFYLEIVARDEHTDILVNGRKSLSLIHGKSGVPSAGVLSLWNSGRNDSMIAFRSIEVKELLAPARPQRSIAGQWESDWGQVTLSHKPIEGSDPVPVTGSFQPAPDKKGTITQGSFDPVKGVLTMSLSEPWRAGTSSARLQANADDTKLEGTWTNDINESGIWTMLRKLEADPGRVPPFNAKPPPPPVAEKGVLDYAEIHDAPATDFTAWIAQMRQTGFRPVNLSIQMRSDVPRYTAIALKEDQPEDWEFTRVVIDEKAASARKHIKGMSAQNYSAVAQALYLEDGKLMWAFLWVNRPARQLDRVAYEDAFREAIKKAVNDKMRPISISAAMEDGRLVMAAIFVDLGSTLRKRSMPLPLPAFQAWFHKNKIDGWRLEQIFTYEKAGETLFSGVFIQDAGGPDWDVSWSLTPDEYDKELPARKNQGFRPHTVVGHKGDAGDQRITAIWLRFRKAPAQ